MIAAGIKKIRRSSLVAAVGVEESGQGCVAWKNPLNPFLTSRIMVLSWMNQKLEKAQEEAHR